MGVYDKLTDLKRKRDEYAQVLKVKEEEHRLLKTSVVCCEQNLAAAKRKRNQAERDKKRVKKELQKLERAIKAHGSQVRKWVKEHPLEALNNNESETTRR